MNNVFPLFTKWEIVDMNQDLFRDNVTTYSLDELEVIMEHNRKIIDLIQQENENIENFINSQDEK